MASDPASRAAARAEIEARIPHRDPFLLVDRILERDERAIRTEWTVPPDADFFRGHYPGEPLLPGVLATEFVVQSGALLVCEPDAEWLADVPVLPSWLDAAETMGFFMVVVLLSLPDCSFGMRVLTVSFPFGHVIRDSGAGQPLRSLGEALDPSNPAAGVIRPIVRTEAN